MTKFIGNTITLPKLATAPSSPVAGDSYYNTTFNKPYTYNGTDWIDLTLTSATTGATGYWGSFWSTQDQTAALANTEYLITYNNTDADSSGVSIVSNSRMTFAYSGVYSIIYSVQFVNTSNSIYDANIWLKKNGSNVSDSDSKWSVVGSHGGVDGHAIGSVNYVLKVTAGDYLELAWQTTGTAISIEAEPAASPAPAIPSIILTATQVMNTQVGPTGATGATGPTGPAATPTAMNYAQTQATKQTTISASGVTIVSTSITTSGYPVQVLVTGDAENNGAGAWVKLQLFRDSTAIGKQIHVESSAGSENVPYALTVIDAPSAGTYTYSLKTASAVAGGSYNFGETDGPVITALELTGGVGPTGATGPAVSLYSSTPAAIAATGSAGSATTAAKGDHVHEGVTSIAGTAGQISASASDGPVTLSLVAVSGTASSGTAGTSFVQSQTVDVYGRVSSVVSATVQDGTTAQKGIVQLNDTPTSGETTKAATSGSVFSVKTTADGALQTSSLGTGVATFLGTPSSANLAAAVTGETGSGSLVFADTPTLITPTIGVATATSVNKVAITAPATSATLTIANGKTLTASNTLTFTGTDSSSVDLGNGGSLVPAGVVQAYMGIHTNIPTGWLWCNGNSYNTYTYRTLHAIISNRFGGTAYAAGTTDQPAAVTTFQVPNLLGHMLVGPPLTGSGALSPGTSNQRGSADAYLAATWDHSHPHSHVTNPAATASGAPSTTVTSLTQTGATSAGSSGHTHTTDIAATTSDTDSTAMGVSPTQLTTRVNYIIKW